MGPRVLVAIPSYQSVAPESLQSLMELAGRWGSLHASNVADFQLAVIPRTLIGDARNLTVTWAKDCQADYLFFLDDDMIFPQDVFERLIAWDQEIVSVFAFKRQPPYDPVPSLWNPTDRFHPVREWPKEGLMPVTFTGCAGMLIKMSVFAKIPDPYFLYYHTPILTVSEDAWFCLQAGKAGIPVYVDCGLMVGHLEVPRAVGLYEYQAYQAIKATHGATLDFPGNGHGGLEPGDIRGTSQEIDLLAYYDQGQALLQHLSPISQKEGETSCHGMAEPNNLVLPVLPVQEPPSPLLKHVDN